MKTYLKENIKIGWVGKSIVAEAKKVDYAFLDTTFLNHFEVKRAMSEVPRPFIEETVNPFKNENLQTKNKVIFIHLNHTNPALFKIANEDLKLNN